MDTKRIIRDKHNASLAVALVLSAIVVTISALLGRGMLNIKSALTADVPTPNTVISLVQRRSPQAKVSNVLQLRHDAIDDTYDFMYEADDTPYWTKLSMQEDGTWGFEGEPEMLR